jgi:hypothetical protein
MGIDGKYCSQSTLDGPNPLPEDGPSSVFVDEVHDFLAVHICRTAGRYTLSTVDESC